MTIEQSTIWIFIIGFGIAGLIIGYLVALFLTRNNGDDTESQTMKNDLLLANQRIETLTGQIEEKHELQGKYESSIKGEEKYRTESESLFKQLQQSKEDIQTKTEQINELNQSNSDLRTSNASLKTRQQEKDKHYEEQLKLLNESKEKLTQEFKNLANEIFDEKGKKFTEQNKSSLDTLLTPFKEQMKEFKEKVESIHHEETKMQATMKAELLNLKELNQQMTEETHNLSTALRGQKKMQGNWGELILENVLDRSGLVKDKDYRREVSIKTENGKQRPDVIVYLPDNKHLIIDAKVSLNAYTDYVNEEDESVRQHYLEEHVKAISNRITELSDKNYFDLPGLNSPDMVFMFIPIESAFVEAVRGDETLFQKAIEKNILVATPTTLLTSLNIVRQLWRFEDQNKHTAELADKAGKVYDKLNTFLGSMEALGNQLGKATDSYGKAMNQLTSGKGNLIKQASEFKQLGVSVKSELPEHLVEKADLELEHLPVNENIEN